MKKINSYRSLCRNVAKQLRTGYLSWPQYEGELGSDSTGGTNGEAYAQMCLRGLLTLSSQEGACTKGRVPIDANEIADAEPHTWASRFRKRYPQLMKDVRYVMGERQKATVTFLAPASIVAEMSQKLRESVLPFLINVSGEPFPAEAATSVLLRMKDTSVFHFSDGLIQEMTDNDVQLEIQTIAEWDRIDKVPFLEEVDTHDLQLVTILHQDWCKMDELTTMIFTLL